MSYRDDLAAAQSRADAALDSLAAEREARENDAAHVAKLERSLARSLEELAELREQVGASVEDAQEAAPSKIPFVEHSLPQVPPSPDSPSLLINLVTVAGIASVALLVLLVFMARFG